MNRERGAPGRRARVALLAALLWLPLAHAVHRVPLTTAAYAPLVEPERAGHGLLGEVVTRTLEEMDLRADYRFQPWKRGQAEVRAGRVWATFPYVKTPDRERLYLFSRNSLFDNRILFFHRRDRFPNGLEWETLADLQPWRLGGVRGYWYQQRLEQAGLSVDYTTTVEAAVRKLEKGRIDLLPITELVGWGLIQRLYPDHIDRFAVLERPYEVVPSYLMASRVFPGSEDLLERFDNAFESLRGRGEIRRIHERYLPPPSSAPPADP